MQNSFYLEDCYGSFNLEFYHIFSVLLNTNKINASETSSELFQVDVLIYSTVTYNH